MKKSIFFLLTCICCNIAISQNSFDQVIYKTLNSNKLKAKRDLKIKLPDDYDPDASLKHPVIIVFDGEYLFEPVVGEIAFQSYFDQMPKAIVIGVIQGKERYFDYYVDPVSGLPVESGARFYEFVSTELLPYIDNNYNTSAFKVVVGQDNMANFMNAFLFKDQPLFQAYVNLSPDFDGDVDDHLFNRLSWIKSDVFYYMATADGDVKHIKQTVEETNTRLKTIENDKLTYFFDEFKDANHNSLVSGAITRSFDKMFAIYKPLQEKELEEKVASKDISLSDYVKKRYEKIESLFGIKRPIRDAELEMIANLAIKKEDFKSLEEIGELAQKQDPDSNLGLYYIAMSAEKSGNKKKAIKLYESALMLNQTELIDKETIQGKLEDLTVASRK